MSRRFLHFHSKGNEHEDKDSKKYIFWHRKQHLGINFFVGLSLDSIKKNIVSLFHLFSLNLWSLAQWSFVCCTFEMIFIFKCIIWVFNSGISIIDSTKKFDLSVFQNDSIKRSSWKALNFISQIFLVVLCFALWVQQKIRNTNLKKTLSHLSKSNGSIILFPPCFLLNKSCTLMKRSSLRHLAYFECFFNVGDVCFSAEKYRIAFFVFLTERSQLFS
jgi:hypothetical protein